MIFSGPHTGAGWALSQVVDAYKGLADLFSGSQVSVDQRIKITNQTAAYLPDIQNESVDLICIDPPYYDNVMYAELSDFFLRLAETDLERYLPRIL